MLRKDWRQRLDGRQVEGILLDTGCARTMVRKDLVSAGKIMMGDVVTIRCAHGDTVLYPLAAVELEVDGLKMSVEPAVSQNLPVPCSTPRARCATVG